MKILIELPTWLGDSVMVTPAIENIISAFNNVQITLLGSKVAVAALKSHPQVNNTITLEKSYNNFFKVTKDYGEFDLFFSFRSSFRSKIIRFYIKAKKKYQFNKNIYTHGHQVEKYNDFVNDSLKIHNAPGNLRIENTFVNESFKNKKLGINPGSAYGDAKRWDSKKFANVANKLSGQYDILIFGGAEEIDIGADIEGHLIANGVANFQNLVDKTSIEELISYISCLDLFITGDSGPMHLAAAFKVPTIAIFGPTNHLKTHQWRNERSITIHKNLECQPCMERTCPLMHQNCMKFIDETEVLGAVELVN